MWPYASEGEERDDGGGRAEAREESARDVQWAVTGVTARVGARGRNQDDAMKARLLSLLADVDR